MNGREDRCQSHDICQTILEILDDLHLDDAVVMGKSNLEFRISTLEGIGLIVTLICVFLPNGPPMLAGLDICMYEYFDGK